MAARTSDLMYSWLPVPLALIETLTSPSGRECVVVDRRASARPRAGERHQRGLGLEQEIGALEPSRQLRREDPEDRRIARPNGVLEFGPIRELVRSRIGFSVYLSTGGPYRPSRDSG
jgi:hypothetical protein